MGAAISVFMGIWCGRAESTPPLEIPAQLVQRVRLQRRRELVPAGDLVRLLGTFEMGRYDQSNPPLGSCPQQGGMPLEEQAKLEWIPRPHEIEEDRRAAVRMTSDWISLRKMTDSGALRAPEHCPRQILFCQARTCPEVSNFVALSSEPDKFGIRQDSVEQHQALDSASQRDGATQTAVRLPDGAVDRLVSQVVHVRTATGARARFREAPFHERREEIPDHLAPRDSGERCILAREAHAGMQRHGHQESGLAL